MTVTISRPLNGQAFGLGFVFDAQTTVTGVPAGGHWQASLVPTTRVGFVTEWLKALTLQSVEGTFGVNEATQTPYRQSAQSDRVRGVQCRFDIEVRHPDGSLLDSGTTNVIFDDTAGLVFMMQFGAGGSAAHDPMLDTILGDVQQAYQNQP